MSEKQPAFTTGQKYTRDEISEIIGQDKNSGGAWFTGHPKVNDEFFIFANIQSSGRTGHNYNNEWIDGDLIWHGNNTTKITQPHIISMFGGQYPVHIFDRVTDRSPFTYKGLAVAKSVSGNQPVKIVWKIVDKQPSTVSVSNILESLKKHGFTIGDKSKKLYSAEREQIKFYIKKNDNMPLVINHNDVSSYDELINIAGVHRPLLDDHYYHNSNMTGFPKRLNKGQSSIHHGLDFAFTSREAVERFIEKLVCPLPQQAFSMDIDPATETEATRAQRLGQTKFRNDLLRIWDKKCALTNIAMPEILRASHIKPWCKSTSLERHNPDNGLLLVVHIDCLFDIGLISFNDDGSLLLSPKLSHETIAALDLNKNAKIRSLSEGNKMFLAHHRAKEFKT